MARRKLKQLNPWETGKTPAQGEHFTRIGKSLLRHPAFTALNSSARLLYICMVEACAGKREFTFTVSDYKACGFAKNTFLRAKEELIQGGFIVVIELGRTTRTPNKYAFSDRWKKGHIQIT